MAQKYQELSDKIVGLVGGKANVQFFTHCVTRLRFNVKDESAVKKDEIEKLPGVLGSQWQNGQYQIIIGQAVNDAYRLICEKNGFAVEKSVDEKLDDEKPAQKKGVKAVIDKIFDGISGSLTPLIPALIGCGMIKVILILMDMAGVPADSGTYQLLTFAGDAGFYFLPIMIGAFAAKKFGANPALGMVIGGLLIYPSFASGVSDGTAFNFLGIPVYGVSYSSTIFPIILCCAVMAPIEKFFAKHSPDILRSVLEPLLTIIVMIPLAYCVLGPIGSFLGTYLSTFVLWLYNTLGFIGVAAFAAVMPFVIMTGMHGAFVPYLMQMLTVDPLYEPIFFPALIISNIDQGIAALAVALKTKDTNLKSTGFSNCRGCHNLAKMKNDKNPDVAAFHAEFVKDTSVNCIECHKTAGHDYTGLNTQADADAVNAGKPRPSVAAEAAAAAAASAAASSEAAASDAAASSAVAAQ